MNDWFLILIVALGLVVWNLSLQTANKRLEHRVAIQDQEIRQLREQINGRSHQNTTGCLDTLFWAIIIASIAFIVLAMSV